MSIWNRIQLTVLLMRLLLNPNRTDLIFKGVDLVSRDPNHELVRRVESAALNDAKFKAMFDENYHPNLPKLEELAKAQVGSFGKAVFEHMTRYGLSFDLFPRLESRVPIHYLSSRIYQDHDLWHALFGYGIEIEDELAIQAFGVAQFESPIAVMLIAGGLIHLLVKKPTRALAAFQKIYDGYHLGRTSPFLLGARLHELFDRPLAEVRQQVLKLAEPERFELSVRY